MDAKRVAAAAAIATGLVTSALTSGTGLVNAAPLDPPPPCPNCQPGPGGPGNGPQNQPSPAAPPNGPQAPQSQPPSEPPANAPQESPGSPPPGAPESPAQGPGGPAPGSPSNAPPGPEHNAATPNEPGGSFPRGNAQVGGPTDAPRGFSTADHGAPPAPQANEPGWNDGPAPGKPPPNWEGPPPPGGWNGPPPPGGWNRPWSGPTRDLNQARADFGPFDYNGYTAVPVFSAPYGGWGFWYFGDWVPLY